MSFCAIHRGRKYFVRAYCYDILKNNVLTLLFFVFFSQISKHKDERLVATIRPDMEVFTIGLAKPHGYEISNARRNCHLRLVHRTASQNAV